MRYASMFPEILRFVANRPVATAFKEHGRSSDPGVVVWQDRITPVWKQIGGGCHLNRKIDDLITGAGFQIVELRTNYLPGPRPMTYTYQGFAHPV